MGRTYLITGGTGFLGSRLALGLLQRGDRVVFLGRSKDRSPLVERVRQNLAAVDSSLVDRLSFDALEVDLVKPGLGLQPKIVDRLKREGVAGIWHAAANLSFEQADRDQVFATNVRGTANVLALSERIGTRLYHISTAYVHGRRRGRILESELVKPRRFNNAYEESKFKAETLLRLRGNAERLVIFRPSILVGKATTARLSALGYYAVLDGFHRCKVRLLREGRRERDRPDTEPRFPVPMLFSRRARLNLMPSDVATTLMLRIADNPASAGGTFHITNPNPFSMMDVARQTFEAVALRGVLVGAPRWMTSLYLRALTRTGRAKNRLPAMFLKRLALYRSYMVQNNVYDMQNTARVAGKDVHKMFGSDAGFISAQAREFLAAVYDKQAAIRRATAASQRVPASAGTHAL